MTAAGPGYAYPLGLSEAYGVELEYMIVDRRTLDVRPVADALFRAAAGHDTSDFEPDGPDGVVSWSNELALHIVEIKSTRPVRTLDGLGDLFQSHVGRINAMLEPMGCRLMPTGMHPWMDPDREMRLWPHENTEIYQAYDRIFGCKGHGWANLQSTHINLPFGNDDEFGRLHAAIRLVLPLIPALAASSPAVDGQLSDLADHRLEVYRNNSKRVPLMAGRVIPEPVYSRAAYNDEIMGRLYDQLAPLDPAGVLRHEFANARGCIARFDRGAIEIRVIDIQECPAADLAVVRLVCAAARALTEERWSAYALQKQAGTEALHAALLDTIRSAEFAMIHSPDLLDAFGLRGGQCRAGEIWARLAEQLCPGDAAVAGLVAGGTLSTRIRRAAGANPDRERLRAIYGRLCDCLATGEAFREP
jgi:gamma-glutamyl:cysteine ligase YbdK (ATP-grasp superfamily)